MVSTGLASINNNTAVSTEIVNDSNNEVEIWQNILNAPEIKHLISKDKIERILAQRRWQEFLTQSQIENLIISVHNKVIRKAISIGVQFWRTGNVVYYRLNSFDKKRN